MSLYTLHRLNPKPSHKVKQNAVNEMLVLNGTEASGLIWCEQTLRVPYLMHDIAGVRLVVQTPRSASVLRPVNLK